MLKTTNSLKVITSPEIFFCLDIRYLDILVFMSVSIYARDILIVLEFSGFLQPCSIKARVAKGYDVVSMCTHNTYYTGGVSLIDAYIRVISIGNSCIKDTCIRDVCADNDTHIRDTSTVSLLEIYLQSSRISKWK